MNAKAYVLIETDSGLVAPVLAALRAIPAVSAAHAVTGPYDIIITIETPDPRDIGRLVMHQVRSVEGIKRTITCLAIDD